MAFMQSLGYWLPVPNETGSLSAYAILFEPHFFKSLLRSIWIGGASALLSVTIGALIAYRIWRLPARLEKLTVIYKIPLILPHIGVAFIILLFWGQSGLVASLAHQLGFIDTPSDFPSIIHGSGGLGMILAYVMKEVPFVIILALAALKRLDPRLIQTATMLGGSQATIFRWIALPQMMPALNTASIILFLYGFGAFDIPFLLGDSSPSMLPVEAYNIYFHRELADRPIAMAILVFMFLFSLTFIVAYTRLASRLGGEERKI